MDGGERRPRAGEEIVVNGVAYATHDRIVSGRQVLMVSNHRPPSEFILIKVGQRRTQFVGPDDEVDLQREAGTAFRAFPGDRAYTFTLDEAGQVWGAETADAAELRSIFAVPEGLELVLEKVEEPDVVLEDGGVVSFAPGGVEHIVIRPRKGPEFVSVTVFSTAGVYPAEGALKVKASTVVRDVLDKAAKKLGLTDTTGWVVSVDGRDIDPSHSFEQNQLAGRVELEWSPREGGGGHA